MVEAIPLQPFSRAEIISLIRGLDPHYAGLLEDFHRSMEKVVDLPPRLFHLCNLGSALALRSSGMTREFMLSSRDAGVPLPQIAEIIFLMTSYGGFPAMSEGLQVFIALFGAKAFQGCKPEEFPPGPEIEGFEGPSLEVGIEMYGPVRARNNVRNFRGVGGPEFARALELYAYGGLFRRRVLEPVDREVITVALLSCLERPGPFAWHLKAALRMGATPQQLRAAILAQSVVGGVLTAFKGIYAANPILDDWLAHPAND